MLEVATVVNLDGAFATVKIDKKDECSKCGLCMFPKNANHIDARVENKIGANKNDIVQIEISESAKLLGAILVFLVPLLLIGLSTAISLLLIKSEIWILLLSLIFIVLWYTILAVIDKKLTHLYKFQGKIVKILQKGEKEGGNN